MNWPAYSAGPNVERWLETQLVGTPPTEVLHGRYVAAICPKCGGWTMMHGDPEGTGKSWMMSCYARKELIVYWKNPISLGLACPDVDRAVDQRTCDQERP